MIEFDCQMVKRELNRLVEAFPYDDVDIWLKAHPGNKMSCTVYLSGRDGLPSESDQDDDLTKAVDTILGKAGLRNGEAKIRAKREAIEKARVELQKLESELDPLVMAIEKANAEDETTSDLTRS